MAGFAVLLGAPLAAQEISDLEYTFNEQTNEHTWQTNVEYWRPGMRNLPKRPGLISLTLSSSCRTSECPPTQTLIMAAMTLEERQFLGDMSLLFQGRRFTLDNSGSSRVGVYILPVPGLQETAAALETGDPVSAQWEILGSQALTFDVGRVREQLIGMSKELATRYPGIPNSPVRLIRYVVLPSLTSDEVELQLHILNDSERDIRGWRGTIQISDPFGDEVATRPLIAGDFVLNAGDIRTATFTWTRTDFQDPVVFDTLKSYPGDRLVISLSEAQTF